MASHNKAASSTRKLPRTPTTSRSAPTRVPTGGSATPRPGLASRGGSATRPSPATRPGLATHPGSAATRPSFGTFTTRPTSVSPSRFGSPQS